MQLFKLKTTVHSFDHFGEFAKLLNLEPMIW